MLRNHPRLMKVSRIVDFMMAKNVFRTRQIGKRAKLVEWTDRVRVLEKVKETENVSALF